MNDLTTSSSKTSQESLDELFSRDPLEMTDKDLDTIVNVLRKERINFVSAENSKKRVSKTKKTAEEAKQVSFDDLDL